MTNFLFFQTLAATTHFSLWSEKNYYQIINLFRFSFPVSNTIFTEKTDALTKIQTTHNYLDEGQKIQIKVKETKKTPSENTLRMFY